MQEHAAVLKHRIDFCRKQLSQGVLADEGDRLARQIMELEIELEEHLRRFPAGD